MKRTNHGEDDPERAYIYTNEEAALHRPLDATSDEGSSSHECPSRSGRTLPTAAMILTPTYIRRVGGVAVGLWIYDERGHSVDRMEKRRATTQPHHRPARSLVIEATSSSKKCGDDVRTILHPRIRHMHQIRPSSGAPLSREKWKSRRKIR